MFATELNTTITQYHYYWWSKNFYALFAQRTQNNGKTKYGHPSSFTFHHSYFWRTWHEIRYSWTTL